MSVLVRGMDMPKGGCWECPLRVGFNCSVLSESVCDYMDGHSMHPNCQLEDVPTPHGDLIDAEELKNILTLGAVTAQMLGSGENTCSDIQFMKEILGEAPTVIEAETKHE